MAQNKLLLSTICMLGINCTSSDSVVDLESSKALGHAPSEHSSSPTPHGFVGVIVARDQVDVSFPAGGVLARRAVKVGDRVELGEVLAELDSELLERDLEEMRAAVRESRAIRVGARTSMQEARDLVARNRQLSLAGIISVRESKEARFTLSRARAEVARTRAVVTQRTVSLEKLLDTQDAALLKAPIAGRVTSYSFDVGARVSSGAVIVSLVSDEREIRFAVPPTVVADLRTGSTVQVLSNDKTWTATISGVMPELDSASQLVFVEATFDHTVDVSLPPIGMRVQVVSR